MTRSQAGWGRLDKLGDGTVLDVITRQKRQVFRWRDRKLLALIVGQSDLVIGPGLLLDHNRRQYWMRARALLSATITLAYALVLLVNPARRKLPSGMLAFMTGITATDCLLWRRLREKEVN